MTLSDRLKAAQSTRPHDELLPTSLSATDARGETDSAAVVDPFANLKRRAQDSLFARLGARLYDSSLEAEQLDVFVVQEVGKVLAAEKIPLTPPERARLVAEIADDVLGYGAIERFLAERI